MNLSALRSAPVLVASVIALGLIGFGAAGMASGAPTLATTPKAEQTYVPIVECRVLDTRVDGGLLKDHARSFQVTGTESLAAQGGNKAGCGIPTEATAVSATIISIDQSGSGSLRATAFGWPLSDNPILVFHQSSVSTAAILPLGGMGTATNITMHAYGAATQVLLDVTGYYISDLT
jgi:hypothetical protein